MTACTSTEPLKISGALSGGEGQTLYFEQLALQNTLTIDSITLNEEGKFSFKHVPEDYPELYRLRTGQKTMIIAADSATHIKVESSVDSMTYFAHADQSASTDIISALRLSLRDSSLNAHKTFARKVILGNPLSIAAYYALFQQKAGEYVFDLYDKADRPYYSAVATAWHTFRPENPRSKALYKLTLDAIQQERKQINRQNVQELIANSENAFLDISLPDENGDTIRLSELRGKVFMLDFSAIGMQDGATYIFELRELYNRYHSRGLEIYSVSADQNRLLWEDSAKNLPWITVRGDLAMNETAFMQYNVQQLPSVFLFDKSGEIVGRYYDFESISKAIDKLLK